MRSLGNLLTKKIVAGALALTMLCSLLFSCFYIAAEADHDCAGENCVICACLAQCESALHRFSSAMHAGQNNLMFAFIAVAAAYLTLQAFAQDTPVSIKVRMNR